MEEPSLKVTACQIYLVKEPMGKTRASARVTLSEEIHLTAIRVVTGANGLFVSYPNDPGYKGEDYKSLFYPLTRALREHIEQVVLLAYHTALSNQSPTAVIQAFINKGAKISKAERASVDILAKYGSLEDAAISVTKELADALATVKALKALRTKVGKASVAGITKRIHAQYDSDFAKYLDSTDEDLKTIAVGLSKGVI